MFLKYKNKNVKCSVSISTLVLALLLTFTSYAQQDPQFTDYMFNTLTVNSAYAGSRGHLTFTGLHRTQWVGLDGAPETQSFSLESPIGKNVGLGFSVVNDKVGPSDEFFFDANFSYTVLLDNDSKFSFGIKGGGRMLDVDFTSGNQQQPGEPIFQDINNNSRCNCCRKVTLFFNSRKSV